MQRVDLVRVKDPLGYGEFKPEHFYLHRMSKKGFHVVLINDIWYCITAFEMLRIDWRHYLFYDHFEIVKSIYVKNNCEARKITINAFGGI